MPWEKSWALMDDRTATTGFDTHYVYFPAWAARIIHSTAPALHIDLSSTLHFAAIVSGFVPVEFYDYRPANLRLSNLTTGKCDLTNLHFESNSILSLSCMHVVEHIGLGRYGDQLDPVGDQRAMQELIRVLAPGGDLLFAVPIGKPMIVFNAHRIYSYRQVINAFKDLELKEFSLVPDNAIDVGMIPNPSEAESDHQDYGCGCFWFKKPR